jgi:hypothetical protein
MKAMQSKTVVLTVAGLLALGSHATIKPAAAAIFTLDNWNVTQLDSTDDKVVVKTGSDCSGGNTICVQWVEGVDEGAPSAIGIDHFWYDVSTTDGESVPSVSIISGNSTSWSFNFDGCTADGFGCFDSKKNAGGADTGGISAALIFMRSGDISSLAQFAAHVRYNNNCSGFVSNRTASTTESNTNCGAQVSEPPVLALSGLVLLGVALVGRRWRRDRG